MRKKTNRRNPSSSIKSCRAWAIFYQHYFLVKFKSRKTQFSRILNYDVQLKHIVRYLKVYLHVHVCDRSMVLFARPRHLCMIRGWQHIRSSSKSFGFCALFVARSTLQHKPYVRTLTIRKVEFVRLRYSDTSSVTAYIYTQIDIIHISLWCAHSHSHRPFIRALRKNYTSYDHIQSRMSKERRIGSESKFTVRRRSLFY